MFGLTVISLSGTSELRSDPTAESRSDPTAYMLYIYNIQALDIYQIFPIANLCPDFQACNKIFQYFSKLQNVFVQKAAD